MYPGAWLVIAGVGQGEAAAVEGDTHDEFLPGGSLGNPVGNAILGVQGFEGPGVSGPGHNGGVVVCLAIPGSPQVICHDVDEVQVLGDFPHIVAFVDSESVTHIITIVIIIKTLHHAIHTHIINTKDISV